jgi:hypothetical protein
MAGVPVATVDDDVEVVEVVETTVAVDVNDSDVELVAFDGKFEVDCERVMDVVVEITLLDEDVTKLEALRAYICKRLPYNVC